VIANRPVYKIGISVIACMAAICILVFGCIELYAINDECNIDRDCRRLGKNLRCESHLCVIDDIPAGGDTDVDSEVDTGPEPNTDTDSEIIPGTDNDPETDTEGLEVFYRYTLWVPAMFRTRTTVRPKSRTRLTGRIVRLILKRDTAERIGQMSLTSNLPSPSINSYRAASTSI